MDGENERCAGLAAGAQLHEREGLVMLSGALITPNRPRGQVAGKEVMAGKPGRSGPRAKIGVTRVRVMLELTQGNYDALIEMVARVSCRRLGAAFVAVMKMGGLNVAASKVERIAHEQIALAAQQREAINSSLASVGGEGIHSVIIDRDETDYSCDCRGYRTSHRHMCSHIWRVLVGLNKYVDEVGK